MQNSLIGNMYSSCATMQSGLRAALWNAAQMYLVFQTVALPLVFNPGTDTVVKFVICLGGIAVSVTIPIVARRWTIRMQFFIKKLAEIEETHDSTSKILVFASPDYEFMRTFIVPVSTMMRIGIIGVLFFWLEEAIRNGRELLPAVVSNAGQFYRIVPH